MTLGDRMKAYEHVYRTYLPKRTYTLIRVDGRGFSNYTRGMDKPFDPHFIGAMDATAQALCREIAGAQFAYTQSDEISVLVTDFAHHETQPWMGGNIAKVLSLSASCATAEFNAQIDSEFWGTAMFDSRVWTMSDANEVANYFIWRQRDAIKNSVSMLAGHHFSHNELEGKTTNERLEMLKSIGIDWFAAPLGIQQGRTIYKRTEITPDSVRSSWQTMYAVPFRIEPGHWLVGQIPPLPSLP